MIKALVRKAFHSVGLDLRRLPPNYGQPEVINPIQPWRDHPHFRQLADELRGRTLVEDAPLFTLYNLARGACQVPGDFAEVGVYKGGTARMLSRIMANAGKQLHLFDTFEGMPQTDPDRDWHKEGDFKDTSLEAVRSFLADSPFIQFHQGFFPSTAGPVENSRFAMVHVDADIYRSVYDCCAFFYPRMSPGGVILFDDYGFTTCPGAKQAVDEYFADKPETPLYIPTGQSVVFIQPHG